MLSLSFTFTTTTVIEEGPSPQPYPGKNKPAGTIHYCYGNIAEPISTAQPRSIIVHACNDRGFWPDAGAAGAISQRWIRARRAYRDWAQRLNPSEPFALGQLRLVCVETDPQNSPTRYVANLITVASIEAEGQLPLLRYDALAQCLITLASFARILNASLHMPYLGCGHAGGDWPIVERLITTYLADAQVIVYDRHP